MKKALILMAAVSLLAAFALPLAAAEGDPRSSGGGYLMGRGLDAEAIKAIGLSDDQVKQIKSLQEEQQKIPADFQKENADKIQALQKAMQEAIKAQDKEATQKAVKDYQDLFAPMGQKLQEIQGKIQDVLTAEQKDKLKEHMAVKSVEGYFRAANLTDEQKKKIRELYAENKDLKPLIEKVRETLTDDQKEAMKKAYSAPAGSPVITLQASQPAPGAPAPGAANPGGADAAK